jgi:hypothetical protein
VPYCETIGPFKTNLPTGTAAPYPPMDVVVAAGIFALFLKIDIYFLLVGLIIFFSASTLLTPFLGAFLQRILAKGLL